MVLGAVLQWRPRNRLDLDDDSLARARARRAQRKHEALHLQAYELSLQLAEARAAIEAEARRARLEAAQAEALRVRDKRARRKKRRPQARSWMGGEGVAPERTETAVEIEGERDGASIIDMGGERSASDDGALSEGAFRVLPRRDVRVVGVHKSISIPRLHLAAVPRPVPI